MSVKSTATAIADNIERAGHYQGLGDDQPWPEGPNMCLIANPAYRSAALDRQAFRKALREKIGPDFWGLTTWNDETPTAEVLATLREIAEESE